MPHIVWPGHSDAELKRRFDEGRASSRKPFGSEPAALCGAQLRSGRTCRQPKLRGHNRCLAHAGPKAAAEFRQRQLRDFERGRISAEEWDRAEARRARNRVNNQWRRDPWLPGHTIDLGEHEADLRSELAYAGFDIEDLAPAVADKARWKWRRFRLDGQSAGKWHAFVSRDLPRRIAKAGPRPADFHARLPIVYVEPVKAPPAGAWSRRRKPDPPRGQKRAGIAAEPQRRQTRKAPMAEADEQTVAHLVVASPELRAALAMCENEGEGRTTISIFQRLIAAPGSAEAVVEWQRWLMALRAI